MGIALVARTAPRQHNVPLLLPHLGDALIGGIMEQVTWSSRRSW
jgi:hypothetical protein